MSFLALLPDLPGCSVEQVSQTEEAILITACATTPSACCPVGVTVEFSLIWISGCRSESCVKRKTLLITFREQM